ncbi:MAG: adenosylcobinamide-phosphate synthase CbiB [Tepidanaerobacteraceae bacterium]|jgi:adenosylcobinamide-phosphate synthase|nr:adenosylcobinamide-phosphate synthase CbiB [Tepidanaerobacteraceae bacterium]
MSKLILAAFLLDLILGDPKRTTHPVVLMGKLISSLESLIRRMCRTSSELMLGGMLLWLIIVGTSYFFTFGVIKSAYGINIRVGQAVSVWLLYTTLAVRNLSDEAMGIFYELKKGNIEKARLRLSGIVGRDTWELPPDEVCRATVETVAENTVDGIVSPLMYAFLGGPSLAMAFKAASTLDSMVGYRSEKYLHIGWFSAKMDDILNYVPARLGGVFMLIAAKVLGLDARQGFMTALRDAKKHESPNGGIPESIMAGAMGVRLGGMNYYSGQPNFRAYMGDKSRDMIADDIKTAVALSIVSSIIALIAGELLMLFL